MEIRKIQMEDANNYLVIKENNRLNKVEYNTK